MREYTPWPAITLKRKLDELENAYMAWRTRLVKIGEEVLQGIEEGDVSEEAKRELRQFIEETKAKGIYKG
jgi:hypothetical protein